MSNQRIFDHPVLGKLTNKPTVTFTFDGEKYEGLEGDTIASALLANGIRTLRQHEHSGKNRGIYCNIGHCFECRVTVDEVTNVRACLTPIHNEMIIESGKVQADPLNPKNKGDLPRTYEEYLQKEAANKNE